MDSQRVRGATDLATYMAASVYLFSNSRRYGVLFSISGSTSRLVRVHRILFSANSDGRWAILAIGVLEKRSDSKHSRNIGEYDSSAE